MNTKSLAIGALAIAFALPLGATAQQYPDQQYNTQQYPAQQDQRPANRTYNGRVPSEARMQQRWNKRLRNLNLSSDQQQRIQSAIHQYSQAHPEGSAPDRMSNRALHRQLMGILSPDQMNQLRQMRRQRRQMMQQRNQPPPNQAYPQGPPAGQEPGPPPA